MLRLVDIVKNYLSGENEVHALKGVSMSFRKSEFVSVLGHSGCGKTTLLNIIGGLDRYSSGDLIINGVSTKEYKDRDWDNYRNHSIGFVFQSYNLIPHQTVLGNVELALTLSGVGKAERRQKAISALQKVGLADQIHKLPNQLSGGQMQRVAIARALVNDPEIILADEPTGALDTETSVQIMEILKEVAANRLVIMVTHNPELAERYSTRIIRLKDGEVIADSLPYEEDLEAEKNASAPVVPEATSEDDKKGRKARREKKPSMSVFTAFALSIRNLFTKKARTFLTAFAGSIGIIGIALILSLSNGFQNYINDVESEALSSYPLTITRTSSSLTLSDLMSLFGNTDSSDGSPAYPTAEKVYSEPLAAEILKKSNETTSINDMKSFKTWLDGKDAELTKLTNAVKYGYALDYCIYTVDEESGDLTSHYPLNVPAAYDTFEEMMNNLSIWEQLVDSQTYLDEQYDVIAGHWPKAYEERDNNVYDVVLAVNKYNRVYDYMLYAIGMMDLVDDIFGNKKAVSKSFTFDELIGKEYKIVLAAEKYVKDETSGLWVEQKNSSPYMKDLVSNAVTIRISGIIRPKEGTSVGSMSGLIGYTSDLTNYMISKTNGLASVQAQMENKEIDITTGEEFENNRTRQTMLKTFGEVDVDTPSSVRFYVKGFEEKAKLISLIDEYNASVSKDKVIRYSDSVAILMSSVNDIVNAISYVLIAFVSISLIVSSIMIGIITYISVLERTKEIGVLRSIGASKRDISLLFDAETMSIGLMSGIFGVIVTLLLNIPINLIIYALTGLSGLAALPALGAVALILISTFLSFIAGFIPSKIAAKKDPVEALRTE